MDDTLVRRIRLAMNSPKFESGLVTYSMRIDFEELLRTRPDIDFSTASIPLLIRTTCEDKYFHGQLGSIGNIHSVLLPYEKLPGVIGDPEVISLSYSTSRFVTDE